MNYPFPNFQCIFVYAFRSGIADPRANDDFTLISGSNALVGRLCWGPARSAGFWIGFAWYHETPFLPTNAAGRAVAHSSVSAMVTLMTFIYFK